MTESCCSLETDVACESCEDLRKVLHSLLDVLTEAADLHQLSLASIPGIWSDHYGDLPRERAFQQRMRDVISEADFLVPKL